MSNGPAGMTGPKKGPTRKEIERAYDEALDRFIRRNQDKKQQQSSVQSVIADMPEKFQDDFAGVKSFGDMNEAQKSIFRFYDDGRTQYSRDINRISQKSPEFAAARARRFPLETFLERMAPVAVGAAMGLPLGLGTAYDEARKLGSATVSGLKKFAQDKGIIPRDDINPNTGTTSVKTDVISPAATSRVTPTADSIFTGVMPTDPQATAFTGVPPTDPQPTAFTGVDPTGPQPTMFTGATPSDPQFFSRFTGTTPTDPGPVQRALPTDAVTQGIQSLFTGVTPQDPRPVREQFSSTFQQPFNPPMIPGGNPRGEVQSARLGALLGSDPNIAYGQEMNMLDVLAERARRGFNEGGLASINNPQYNMLMKASDFDI